MKDKLSPRGRCHICGRFMKRGLLNWIKHYDKCLERKIIFFSLDPTKCRVGKYKEILNEELKE
jgi:hypothetical protein